MSKIKNSGLDHGAEPFELQQFGTAGVEGVKFVVVGCFRCLYTVRRCLPGVPVPSRE